MLPQYLTITEQDCLSQMGVQWTYLRSRNRPSDPTSRRLKHKAQAAVGRPSPRSVAHPPRHRVTQPIASALILTYVLGLLLLISGIVRILLGVSHWKNAGWIMLLSGAFGVLAGLVILTGFPMTGLWVLGLLLGVDLMSHGIAWLTYAWQPAAKTA